MNTLEGNTNKDLKKVIKEQQRERAKNAKQIKELKKRLKKEQKKIEELEKKLH